MDASDSAPPDVPASVSEGAGADGAAWLAEP
ncbi:hypothetical protein GA0115239_104247, partial [Streptomyces sp. BpilaLS-43]